MARTTNKSRIIKLLYKHREGLARWEIMWRLNLSETSYEREREGLLREDLAEKRKGQGGGLRLTAAHLDELDKEAGIEGQESATGSAFFVSSMGHLITNQHVVEGARRVVVAFNGQQYKATVEKVNSDADLALLKIDYSPKILAPFRDSAMLGEDVGAFGFPLSDDLTKTGNFTRGCVTGIAGMADAATQFQFQAPIQGGNSGGPVADANGNIVGVVVASVRKSLFSIDDMPENTNFAIRAETVVRFAREQGLEIVETTQAPNAGDWRAVAAKLVSMTALVYCDEGYGEVPDSLHPPKSSVDRLRALSAMSSQNIRDSKPEATERRKPLKTLVENKPASSDELRVSNAVLTGWIIGSGALVIAVAALVWAIGGWPF